MTGCSLLATFLRLSEVPGMWLTNFVDSAEEIWTQDPFLIDDDDGMAPHSA